MILKAALVTTSAFFLISIPSGLTGAEWYVSPPPTGSDSNPGTAAEPFATIQKGIDTSTHGDTVVVAQKTYIENIAFNGKNIVLTSTDPLNPRVVDATIVDGNQAGSVVTFAGTEDETCVLSGFTLRNGKAERGGGILGGTFDDRTHASIRNNTIAGNSASYGGAACYCDGMIENNLVTGNSAEHYGGGLAYCGGTIRGNTITDNDAWGFETGYGGGLGACGATIENNTIAGNHAKDGGGVCLCIGIIRNNTIVGNRARDGGGIGGCNGTIENNTVTGNDASRTGGGVAWCDASIRNNTITGNRAAGDGGGLYGCNRTIQNNTINGNSAEGDRGGGGLAFCNGIIQNNLVSANSARHGGGLDWCDGTLRCNTVTRNSASYGGGISECHGAIGNSIVWGNSAATAPQVYNSATPTYSCIQDWTGGGERNIDLDPRFVDPDGPDDMADTYEDNDFRLTPASPCIDKALSDDSMWIAADLDGNPRIWRGLFSWTVDMGAYEYESSQFKCIEIAVLCLPPPGECGVTMTWNSRPGDSYTVMSCSQFGTEEWVEEGTVQSAGELTNWIDASMGSALKFYKIRID